MSAIDADRDRRMIGNGRRGDGLNAASMSNRPAIRRQRSGFRQCRCDASPTVRDLWRRGLVTDANNGERCAGRTSLNRIAADRSTLPAALIELAN